MTNKIEKINTQELACRTDVLFSKLVCRVNELIDAITNIERKLDIATSCLAEQDKRISKLEEQIKTLEQTELSAIDNHFREIDSFRSSVSLDNLEKGCWYLIEYNNGKLVVQFDHDSNDHITVSHILGLTEVEKKLYSFVVLLPKKKIKSIQKLT